MANKLKEFVAQVKTGGVSKTSRYSVVLTPPPALQGMVDMRKILLFCSDVSLPGANMSTAQLRQYGEVREVPYEKMFDNINMTFLVDTNLQVKLLFDRWFDLIQNPYTRTFSYYDTYVSPQMDIIVEDLHDNARYVVTTYENYPKSISPISLGYDQKDVMKLQISMNYKYWMAAPRSAPAEKKEAWYSRFLKTPTINGQPIPGTTNPESGPVPSGYMSDFRGFQQSLSLPETQNQNTGVVDWT